MACSACARRYTQETFHTSLIIAPFFQLPLTPQSSARENVSDLSFHAGRFVNQMHILMTVEYISRGYRLSLIMLSSKRTISHLQAPCFGLWGVYLIYAGAPELASFGAEGSTAPQAFSLPFKRSSVAHLAGSLHAKKGSEYRNLLLAESFSVLRRNTLADTGDGARLITFWTAWLSG